MPKRSGLFRLILGVAIATCAPSAPPALAQVDWPTYGFGPLHRGENTAETAIGPSNVGTLALAWDFNAGQLLWRSGQLDCEGISAPTVVDGALYATCRRFGTMLLRAYRPAGT
jgi:glucose dehydrogenase